jgi:hypothetical protein
MKKTILFTLLALANLSPALASMEVKVSCTGPSQGRLAGDRVTGNLVVSDETIEGNARKTTGSLTIVTSATDANGKAVAKAFKNVVVKGVYVDGANSYGLVMVESKTAKKAVDSVYMNFNDSEDGANSWMETSTDHNQRPLSCKKVN